MVTRGWMKSLLLGCLVVAGLMQSAIAAVEVSIDRNPVRVNESFQVVFSLDYSPDREPDFSILQQHFLILNNSRTNSISIVNGEYRRSVKWILQLMAKQEGEFMVPAIRFDQERSKPFQVTVKAAAAGDLEGSQLVLELLAEPQEVYVQSQVLLRLRLLSATDLSAYQFGDIAVEGVDAVLEPLGDTSQYQTRIAGKDYLVLEKRFALFPQQAGQIEIPPVIAEVRLPSRQRYDPFQTGGEVRRLRSQMVNVEVKPIPEGYNAPYWLPAKKIELREDWPGDLGNLVAGEPVTRGLTLVAEGLTAAQLPEFALPHIDGIKQYPDQPALDDRRSTRGITGTREQKVALIPGSEGRYLIPEIRIPWWNVDSGQMETAVLPARVLNVAAPAMAAELPRSILPATEEAAPAAPAQTGRFWLWLSLMLALGWAASAVYWWYRTRRESKPAAGSDEHPSLRQARQRLHRACNDNDAAAARAALLDWGRALLAPQPVAHLQQLARQFGADMAAEIAQLNQSLYAPAHRAWQGESLWRLCAGLESRERQTTPGSGKNLLPLNPSG